MTATHASRGFSEVLDAVEHGDTITITRGGVPIAEIRPVPAATGHKLALALDEVSATLDDDVERDVAAATALLVAESDPWRDA
ncbi:type II toxin-antitoxin system Phd/YefM family antitoxin [Cellulomonas composti]|uniref:Antitoxin n=1 Tax=Cellulomonas composti TaxID=266130 RepID=A0A511JA21_9CELL|nr:type II toxin-antitoxin system prevent-host-death family antitoxin [Cellulomonas composti]GEL94840.1 hypothetical protein CCO02nite_14980 [Cellulomonas composti]